MCHCFSGCSIRGGKKTLIVWVQETRADKGFPCQRLKYLHLLHRSVFLFVHFYELPMRHVLSFLYLSQNWVPGLLWSSEVKVAQSCPTLCDHMGYPVQEILQARILEWVAFPFSRGSSQPSDQTQVFHIECRLFTSWVTRKGSSCIQLYLICLIIMSTDIPRNEILTT